MVYPEDIIEETLQHGVLSAMNRFSLTKKEVADIVNPFTKEIDDKLRPYCSCNDGGPNLFCFIPCPINKRKI